MIGLESLDFDGEGGLLEHRSEIPEYQRRKSARHCLASMLAVATAATLSGARHVAVPGEYAADLSHEESFPRSFDAAALDQVRGVRLSFGPLVIALDGKSLCGSLRDDGWAVHLFSAMIPRVGVVIGHEEVDEKSNEITVLGPLLDLLNLADVLVTDGREHCQVDHAHFLVEQKGADFLFQVKENQPILLSRGARSKSKTSRKSTSPLTGLTVAASTATSG